ncbi:MAG TPA: glycosyltransferase family 4 protein [Micromonosporaceae bacterium]
MEPDRETTAPAKRGRVVMLVDNGVIGDSRVQKAAGSAAAAGWEVTLLGIMGQSGPQQWRIGDAQVRLVKVATRLTHPAQFRRAPLRRPLAYPPGRIAGVRIQQVKAWKADLATRQAMLTVAQAAGASRGRVLAGRARLVLPRLTAKVIGRWAKFRAGELYRLQQQRGNPNSPLVKVPMRFWQKVLKERSWRKLDPGLWEFELAFGKVIDELKPDLIHAHDFRMIGVGARAALRARANGRTVKFVYDAHEFLPGITGRPSDPRWLPAQVAYEKEFIGLADAVMTISPTLAELLQRTHGLPELPAVVLNAPSGRLTGEQEQAPVPDLRALCGIGADTPLLAYCGGINPVRGVDLIVEALPHLPGVHVALVSLHPNGKTKAADELQARAAELGVADRVHVLAYVPYWQVPRFLAPADAAVSPLHHLANHEIALSNKFFEYSQARLPLVTSDVKTMAEVVRETGQGEVFRAKDLPDYVRAVQAVLADPQRYRAAYDKPGLLASWTWEAQAEVMDEVYRRLRPDLAGPDRPVRTPDDAVTAQARTGTPAAAPA